MQSNQTLWFCGRVTSLAVVSSGVRLTLLAILNRYNKHISNNKTEEMDIEVNVCLTRRRIFHSIYKVLKPSHTQSSTVDSQKIFTPEVNGGVNRITYFSGIISGN
jgi:hypothetical protein